MKIKEPAGHALEPLERMELMISLIPYLKERVLLGDMFSADAVYDLEEAIAKTSLTDMQRRVIDVVMLGGATYREASLDLGVHFTTLAEHGKNALEKIYTEYKRGENDAAN